MKGRFSLALLFVFGVVTLFQAQLNDVANTKALELNPKVSIAYYDIEGESSSELRKAMDKRGPVDQFGRRRDAFTKWHITWKWPFLGSSPRYSDATADYNIEITLPRWKNAEGAPEQLVKRWKGFVDAVVKHEKKHIEIVEMNYENIAMAIRKAAEDNLVNSEVEANRIARKEVDKIHALDKELDRDTKSGQLMV